MSEIIAYCPHCNHEHEIPECTAASSYHEQGLGREFCQACDRPFTTRYIPEFKVITSPNIPGYSPCNCEICKEKKQGEYAE